MKFSIKDFFSPCKQLRICSHLLKKYLIKNFIFCAEFLSQYSEFPLFFSRRGVSKMTKCQRKLPKTLSRCSEFIFIQNLFKFIPEFCFLNVDLFDFRPILDQ